MLDVIYQKNSSGVKRGRGQTWRALHSAFLFCGEWESRKENPQKYVGRKDDEKEKNLRGKEAVLQE